jgi:hypothetical protein
MILAQTEQAASAFMKIVEQGGLIGAMMVIGSGAIAFLWAKVGSKLADSIITITGNIKDTMNANRDMCTMLRTMIDDVKALMHDKEKSA